MINGIRHTGGETVEEEVINRYPAYRGGDSGRRSDKRYPAYRGGDSGS